MRALDGRRDRNAGQVCTATERVRVHNDLLELRAQLGIASEAGSPAFVLPNGEPLAADQLTRRLRASGPVRTRLEAKGGICRSLLQARHGLATDPEEVRG